MKDNLVICKKCKGNACYQQELPDNVTTWLCFGCGSSTSTLFTKGSTPVKNAIETAPELYKELLFEDEDGLMWLPATVTLPGKGMVFLDGTTSEDWNWSAINAVSLTDEEKASGKFPAGEDYKADTSNMQKFGKADFMDALQAIGFFEIKEGDEA